MDSFNIYLRLSGETAYAKVAERRSRFPVDDTTPLKVAGRPETREYMIMGVIADEEIGLPSDLAVVTYGG